MAIKYEFTMHYKVHSIIKYKLKRDSFLIKLANVQEKILNSSK